MSPQFEDKVLELLSEMVHWQRFQNRQTLRAVLEEVLSTDTDKLIYDLTDGERNQPEIAKRVNLSQPAISKKWKAWRKLGIVYDLPDEPGRCRHLASLDCVGLPTGE